MVASQWQVLSRDHIPNLLLDVAAKRLVFPVAHFEEIFSTLRETVSAEVFQRFSELTAGKMAVRSPRFRSLR